MEAKIVDIYINRQYWTTWHMCLDDHITIVVIGKMEFRWLEDCNAPSVLTTKEFKAPIRSIDWSGKHHVAMFYNDELCFIEGKLHWIKKKRASDGVNSSTSEARRQSSREHGSI
jgi:hypothetical protein